MAEHIPFITSEDSARIVRNVYADSEVVKLPLERVSKLLLQRPKDAKIWLDPGVDGFDDVDQRRPQGGRRNPWFEFMNTMPQFGAMEAASKNGRPSIALSHFVTAILDQCASHTPAWLTVPQLPLVSDASRNKVNRALAAATGQWKSSHGFAGRLILPIIVTHQDQVNGKTARNPKVQQAERCYHDAQSDGFWVVDKSLADDSGSATLRNKRLPGVTAFHEELNERIPSKLRIAGPYWGLNLVLWARGLVDYPLIGVGGGYQMFLSGGTGTHPTARVALAPLWRRVEVGPDVEGWLDEVMAVLTPSHPAHREFQEIRKRFASLRQPERAREQVAIVYKHWFDAIASAPKAGRSMAFFQELSAAYALGKSLPDLAMKGTARRPEAVAEPLMLSCL